MWSGFASAISIAVKGEVSIEELITAGIKAVLKLSFMIISNQYHTKLLNLGCVNGLIPRPWKVLQGVWWAAAAREEEGDYIHM